MAPPWSKYEKKYNHAWEKQAEMRGWLTQAPSGHAKEGEAYCTVCKIAMRPQLADLKKHASTKTHLSKMSSLNRTTQPTLSNLGVSSTNTISNTSKVIDLKLALYIAKHSSTRSIDHLGEMLKVIGVGSKLENLRLHRTKCSALIKSVLAPSMLSSLVEDIGDNGYSLIVDESTDVSVCKYMCLCVRYFSVKQQKIVTDYLGIIEVVRATANDLFDGICTYLNQIGLKLSNIVGLGTDGGSNLCGKNHSVFTLMKEKVPNIQLIKCVCHSVHLCSSKAAEELPSTVDFLLKETYSWFSCSPLRRHKYREIYALINNAQQPLNLVQLSQTRWLSRFEAVARIVDQWLELETHFNIASQEDKCYSGRLLSEMFKDHSNFLYLIFVKPILRELNSVNLSFQHTNADVTKVYSDLKCLTMSIAKRIIRPEFLDTNIRGNAMLHLSDVDCIKRALENPLAFLPNCAIDFGILFKEEEAKKKVTDDQLKVVKSRCHKFLITLCQQLVKRLPESLAVVKGLRSFTPEVCLSQLRPAFDTLPLELLSTEAKKKIDILETQWQKVLAVSWENHFASVGGIVECDTERFWTLLHGFKDAGGRLVFRELSDFAMRLLSMPLSNAIVERAFSIMNATKTPTRNRINMTTLDALMRIRIHTSAVGICCNNFEPTPAMIAKFSSDMYIATINPETTDSEELELEEYAVFFGDDLDHTPVD